MILKAGTYRFNDVIKPINDYNPISIDLIFDYSINNVPYNYFGLLYSNRISSNSSNENWVTSFSGIFVDENGDDAYNTLFYDDFYHVAENGDVTDSGGWQSELYKNMTITADTEVDDTFGTWYISNTNYNEVNAKPLAEITYNGETIAQLNAGETAVIKCAEKRMVTDIIIKINS